MTLIRSRSLFDHGEDESVSAPLRTFIRNSDGSHLNARSSSYNIQRRSSRRSAYSFRVHSSSHDDANKDEVCVLSVESRDLSNPSGRKFSSSQNGMFADKETISISRHLLIFTETKLSNFSRSGLE
jgi:hypothetical protein